MFDSRFKQTNFFLKKKILLNSREILILTIQIVGIYEL